jgi:hypothetical protein
MDPARGVAGFALVFGLRASPRVTTNDTGPGREANVCELLPIRILMDDRIRYADTMSSTATQSNLEVVKGAYDAFARGAIDEVIAVMAEDVEWIEPEGSVDGGTYRGPDAVVENVFVRLGTDWEGFEAEPERFVADGDTVVAIGQYRGTARGTGERLSSPFAHVVDLEDGVMVRFEVFSDSATWNRALGA